MGHSPYMVIIIKYDSIPVCGYYKQILTQYIFMDIMCLLDSISSYDYYIGFWFIIHPWFISVMMVHFMVMVIIDDNGSIHFFWLLLLYRLIHYTVLVIVTHNKSVHMYKDMISYHVFHLGILFVIPFDGL